jgi:hypothetical protein
VTKDERSEKQNLKVFSFTAVCTVVSDGYPEVIA